MKQFLTYFSTFLLMSVLSCEQQELSISSHIDSQTIRVKNSRLAFASSRELTDFVNAQKKLGFDRFKKSLNGHLEKEFTSLLPVFDRDDLEKVDNYRSFKIEQ